jgi:hypothetical protein
MVEKLDEIQKNLDAIKSTIVGTAPQKNKDRRLMSLSNMALEALAEIEKGAKNGV